MRSRLVFLILSILILLAMSGTSAQDTSPRDAWPTNGWQTSVPEQQGMDSAAPDAGPTHLPRQVPDVHAFLVVRHGAIVAESYANGSSADDLNNLYSVTKSVTSALVGMA